MNKVHGEERESITFSWGKTKGQDMNEDKIRKGSWERNRVQVKTNKSFCLLFSRTKWFSGGTFAYTDKVRQTNKNLRRLLLFLSKPDVFWARAGGKKKEKARDCEKCWKRSAFCRLFWSCVSRKWEITAVRQWNGELSQKSHFLWSLLNLAHQLAAVRTCLQVLSQGYSIRYICVYIVFPPLSVWW